MEGDTLAEIDTLEEINEDSEFRFSFVTIAHVYGGDSEMLEQRLSVRPHARDPFLFGEVVLFGLKTKRHGWKDEQVLVLGDVDIKDAPRGNPGIYKISAKTTSEDDFSESELQQVIFENLGTGKAESDLGFLVWSNHTITRMNSEFED